MFKNFVRHFSNLNRPFGLHTMIDLKGCDKAKISNGKYIEKYVIELCKVINMERYGEAQIVKFGEDPRLSGYSLSQLITTSNVSGHFVDATGEAYIDVFSCKDYDGKVAGEFTKSFFGADSSVINILVRK